MEPGQDADDWLKAETIVERRHRATGMAEKGTAPKKENEKRTAQKKNK